MTSTSIEGMSVNDVPIRALDLGDLRDCLLLAVDRRWLPEEAKWRLLFDIGEVYGVDDPAGGLAGTAVVARYGPGLAAVSMVLVAARHGRKGLGRRLMLHVIERAAGATLFLTATEYGRTLYERVGFTEIGTVVTHTGPLAPLPADLACEGIRPARPDDVEAMVRLDAEASGAPRAELVSRLPAFAERVRVVERDGAVVGFGAAWRNVDNVVIGPVVAESTAMAVGLVSHLAAGVHGPVRLDLDDRHADLTAWAVGRGVAPAFSTALMVHGGPLPGRRDRLFTPVMVALG
ncbi:GNAT family N-acetyltransferase [Sphaerisporangium sp. TRM90804]|uniref:GNAT family N-acetyltransferase n=1 Tax=Sphaerisporangium sp. TRM90804 TaxID=3031113 RepID=UPI00244B8EA3|nr:GNAT family N-acetyltransferase [Sphaerisporangium sp. TRM90804]MDH2429821.1 GNAT family N-acetyltransferase [Sphaerisporangium sp. TRM90804]